MNQERKNTIGRSLKLIAYIGLVVAMFACKTKKFSCPAYNEYPHRALADSSDPSNSMKMYYYYPVMEAGANEDTIFTSATNVEDLEDDSKSNEELLHENDLAKEKEEEWKPYSSFNIRMEVDSMGKPTSYKPVKYKDNGLAVKKKPKNINVDKELAEDKKKKDYSKVEDDTPQPQ